MKELGITKGEWKVSGRPYQQKTDGEHHSCFEINNEKNEKTAQVFAYSFFNTTIEKAEANAKLIADAGTTANKCNLLPSELLAQRDELLQLLKNCIKSMKFSVELGISGNKDFSDEIHTSEQAIKNAQQ